MHMKTKMKFLKSLFAIAIVALAFSCSEKKTEQLTETSALPVPPPPPSDIPVPPPPPSFPGGDAKLMEYLKKNIKYPENAKKNKIEGKVYIAININTDGSIGEVKTLKSSGSAELDEEAVRVVKTMPNWEPSIIDGKAVAGQFNLPIFFKLSC